MTRWHMLALLFAARIGLGINFQTMGSTGDQLADTFGLGYAQIGLMIGFFTAPGLFLALPAGYAGRFATDRVLCGLGLAGLAIGALVTAAAPGPDQIAVGRLVAGAGGLFSMLYFTKMAADWFEGREMATAMSILVMSWPFGIAIGQVGHTWLAEAFGWRVPFLVAAVYCAVAALAVFALYRAPTAAPRLKSTGTARLLPQEWMLVACAGVAWGAFNAGYIIYLSFGPEMLKAQGLTVLAAASIISVGSWLMIGSGTICGQIADRLGHTNRILAVTMAAAIVALLLLQVPGAGLWASLLFGLVGMAPAGVIIALAGQAVAIERRAFGMGVFLTIYYAIITAAPPLAGWIFDKTGAPQGAILLAIGLFGVVLPAAMLFRVIKSRPVPTPTQETA
ncbi:MFS transporter [Roseicyclus marinus]|uniref:MFS transporter n=1 Tax=Roseicyclus marinus TaxID=2161673 RepID=UPI0024100031|nr:MFS transporter [Roseicyclus marinus]MDG3041754.1 MFS transporter [Roseicyclus marinus]